MVVCIGSGLLRYTWIKHVQNCIWWKQTVRSFFDILHKTVPSSLRTVMLRYNYIITELRITDSFAVWMFSSAFRHRWCCFLFTCARSSMSVQTIRSWRLNQRAAWPTQGCRLWRRTGKLFHSSFDRSSACCMRFVHAPVVKNLKIE